MASTYQQSSFKTSSKIKYSFPNPFSHSLQRFPADKYAYIKSRLNTFDNFEYKPGQIIIPPKRKYLPVKKPVKKTFGKLVRSPGGRPKIFNEVLHWNVQSKLKSYTNENIHYRPPPSQIKVNIRENFLFSFKTFRF